MSYLYEPSARSPIASPSGMLTLLEPTRAATELFALWFSAPMLLAGKRGDGHPVLVLPGFGAADASTSMLRAYLSYLGYQSAEWSLGHNFGYRSIGASETLLRERVREIADASGQKISLVGWSLGGVMARHMARDYPELIRQVITLGAPFTGNPLATNLRQFYELMSGDRLESDESQQAWEANRAPPAVPTTSIYSKSDGIVAWRNCLEIETDIAENVEVVGCHMGLPQNPLAYHVIADRLAQDQATWQKFAPSRSAEASAP